MFKNIVTRATELPTQIYDNRKELAQIASILTVVVAGSIVGNLIGQAINEALYND